VRKRPTAMACFAIGGGAVGLALATPGPEVTGCTTHQCDQSSYEWPPALDGSCGGFMQSEDLYVSNDLNAMMGPAPPCTSPITGSQSYASTWLDYHGNTTIKLWFPPEVAGRTVQSPIVDVGIDDMPNALFAMDAGINYTTAVGQLAILNALIVYPKPVKPPGRDYLVGGSVTITNTTCATYFAHVEVTFGPRLAEAGVGGSE
jgi:hypothetical protein